MPGGSNGATPASNNGISYAVPEQTSASTPAAPVPVPYPNQSASALPATIKHRMEVAFGTDLTNIKLVESHAPMHASAVAFTSGNGIHFAPGAVDLHSPQGERFLAHELAHVLQQRGGRVANQMKSAINAAIRNFTGLEDEAERTGIRAAQL